MDEIGAFGITAKEFLADLGELKDASRITLRINSPGGSVFDGIAIYNALRRHPAQIIVLVEGIAASGADERAWPPAGYGGFGRWLIDAEQMGCESPA